MHRPAETVKYTMLGGGGGGARGGSGGGGGFEHTRQPVETYKGPVSEYHRIDPAPNVKAEGPFVSSVPVKDTSAPAVLGILRKS